MYNYNFNNLEQLKDLGGLSDFFKVFAGLGLLVVFLGILLGIVSIFLWIFSSLGIMNVAKKNNIPYPWLAFLPVGRSYLIGKLGFEVYAPEGKKNSTFTWITLGIAGALFILSNSNSDMKSLLKCALIVFETWGFYNIFKALVPEKSTLYTVLSCIFRSLLGGIFLYNIKTEPNNNVNEQPIEEAQVATKKNESKKTETPLKENKSEKFCTNCGTKMNKNANFCPSCGKKAN